jgi:hypothetical protein
MSASAFTSPAAAIKMSSGYARFVVERIVNVALLVVFESLPCSYCIIVHSLYHNDGIYQLPRSHISRLPFHFPRSTIYRSLWLKLVECFYLIVGRMLNSRCRSA